MRSVDQVTGDSEYSVVVCGLDGLEKGALDKLRPRQSQSLSRSDPDTGTAVKIFHNIAEDLDNLVLLRVIDRKYEHKTQRLIKITEFFQIWDWNIVPLTVDK